MSFSSFAFQKLFDVSECKINDQEQLLRHKNTDICLTIQESQSNVSYLGCSYWPLSGIVASLQDIAFASFRLNLPARRSLQFVPEPAYGSIEGFSCIILFWPKGIANLLLGQSVIGGLHEHIHQLFLHRRKMRWQHGACHDSRLASPD